MARAPYPRMMDEMESPDSSGDFPMDNEQPTDFSRILLDSVLQNSVLPTVMQPFDKGGIFLGDQERAPTPEDLSFGDNLAESMGKNELNRLASELSYSIEADYDSGAKWREEFKKGMTLMGITDESLKGPFTHASMAVHPMIAEGCIRFWARTMPEILPMRGPVKAAVQGKPTAEKEDMAARTESYMNYQIVKEDLGYRDHTNKLIFQLPLRGCGFKKTVYDDEMDTVQGIYVPPDEMIAQYGIQSFKTAGRFTHRYFMAHHQLIRKQVMGVYLDVQIGEPQQDDTDMETQTLKDQASGVEANEESNVDHIIDECYVMLDLPGFEDLDPVTKQPTGLPLPYIVTMEKQSGVILSIYRDYREKDVLKRRISRWVKYEYMPGFGFYGLGLIGLIGSLADQSSALMRIITNGGAFASIPGGFKPKDGRMGEGQMTIEPGVYKPVDATYDELSKSFYTPNIKGPEPVLVTMLQHGEAIAQRITSTQDIMTGDANSNAPVGTTMALIEKAMEIGNAIQVNVYSSLQEELDIRFDFIADYMPVEGRQFFWGEGEEEQSVDPFTFDRDNVYVQPSSDPAQSSTTKRLAAAQMTYQMAQENPDVLSKEEAIRRMLIAAEIPDHESMFVSQTQPQPMDPISEGFALLNGAPIKAFEDQDHQAHIAVHMAFMQNPEYGGNPEVAKVLGPIMQAHLGEHMAFWYVQQAMQTLQMPIPMPQAGPDGMQSPLPPEQQAMLAAMAGQASQQFMQFAGLPAAPQPDPNAEQQQKLQHREQEHEQKMRHKALENELTVAGMAEKLKLDSQGRTAKLLDDSARADIARDEKRAAAAQARIEAMNNPQPKPASSIE